MVRKEKFPEEAEESDDDEDDEDDGDESEIFACEECGKKFPKLQYVGQHRKYW